MEVDVQHDILDILESSGQCPHNSPNMIDKTCGDMVEALAAWNFENLTDKFSN